MNKVIDNDGEMFLEFESKEGLEEFGEMLVEGCKKIGCDKS
jgi:hypothetical protein